MFTYHKQGSSGDRSGSYRIGAHEEEEDGEADDVGQHARERDLQRPEDLEAGHYVCGLRHAATRMYSISVQL